MRSGLSRWDPFLSRCGGFVLSAGEFHSPGCGGFVLSAGEFHSPGGGGFVLSAGEFHSPGCAGSNTITGISRPPVRSL
jgi:hypothetical protein